jgi:hypothetical protein
MAVLVSDYLNTNSVKIYLFFRMGKSGLMRLRIPDVE